MTNQLAGKKSLRVAKPLDVARDRVTHEPQHLADRERHAHSVRPIRMACHKPPQVTKCDNRLYISYLVSGVDKRDY